MRFNPKARLDTSRTRDRGHGRAGGFRLPAGGTGRRPGGRGPARGGVAAGGGIGTVVLIVVFALVMWLNSGGGSEDTLGVGDTSRMAETERYAHCLTGQDAQEDSDCARVAVENSLHSYWKNVFEKNGETLRPAVVNTFSGATDSACGQAASQVGPFYCPADQEIYLDTTFFVDVLQEQLGGQGGDFVEPYVLAHEYGHHVQNLRGILGRVRTQQGPESDAVRLELQADCYAGMWTRAATGTTDVGGVSIITDLDQGDIDEAVDSAKTVGDDRIQQRSGARVDSDHWTHGSSAQRTRWFMTGYEQGSLRACDTFAARSL